MHMPEGAKLLLHRASCLRESQTSGHLQVPVALLEGLDDSNVVQDDKLTQVVDVTPDLCK